MASYVVTGGTGFIGSHLTRALVARGDRVRVVDDLSSGRIENLADLEVGEPDSGRSVELHRGCVTDAGVLAGAMAGAKGVFHEAAQVSVPGSIQDPVGSYRINVMGTLAVLEAARSEGDVKVLFAASSAAYGDEPTQPKVETMEAKPLSPYASGKVAGEALMAVWARAYGMRTVALRYFNVYGPGQADNSPYSGVIALFAKAVLGGRAPTIFGDGEQSRDFVFVGDVVRANLLAMDREVEPGGVINVGTGGCMTINELYRLLARFGDFSGQPTYGAPRGGDVPHSQASIERARGWLGFAPEVGFEEGLRVTLDWYRSRR